MTGAPTAVVKLDDGTGTFPYDISAYVDAHSTVTWGRGRGDESEQVSPGTLTLTLENTDGRFSQGDPTYNVQPDQAIRVTVAGSDVFTGRVQAWPVQWPGGGQSYSTITVTASDDMARIARRVLFSAAQEEITADLTGSAAAFWRLDEPVAPLPAFTVGHDAIGNAPAFSAASISAGYPQFGQTLGTPDGANGVQITGNATTGSIPLHLVGGWNKSFTSLHFEITYNLASALAGNFIELVEITNPADGTQLIVQLETGLVRISRPGLASYTVTLSSYIGLHALAFDTDATSSVVTFDGVQLDSRAGSAYTYDLSNSFNSVRVGANFNQNSNTITVGNIGLGPKLSSTRTILHQNVILNDEAGETPAARIARVASYASATVGTLDSAGSTTLSAAGQAGKTALDAINEATGADLGIAWVNGSGALTSIAGTTLADDAAPDATIDASWVQPDAVIQVDMQSIVNYSVGSAVGSTTGQQTVVQDATSITAHGAYRTDYQWAVNSDAQAIDRTQWTVGVHADPLPRTPTLTLDLFKMDATTLAAALTLDVGKYLRVTGMPSQTPGGTQLELQVQGATWNLSETAWTVTLNCTPKMLTTGWILGDSTWGVLDSTTRLYVS